MSEWGISNEGISTPSYSEILDYLAFRWKEEFGTRADLSSRSPEGQLFRVIAEQFSNKGLGWSEIKSQWDAIEELYYSAYVPTANGAALDHTVSYRALVRGNAQPATGILVFKGSAGETIPAGTQASTQEGTTFETRREATINRYGVVPVPAECVSEGEKGNIISGLITKSSTASVKNINDSHTFHYGSLRDYWETLQNEDSIEQFQVVKVNNIKYGTSVNKFELPVRATKDGLCALQLLILDHESGEELFRTEAQEKKLTANEVWQVRFGGENFDWLAPHLSNELRVVPVTLGYSTTPLEVALQNQTAHPAWYHASTPQDATLNMSITSQVQGAFTGGVDRESDSELRTRYLQELSKGGGSRPAALRAQLYDITSVKHAQVLENATPSDYRPGGLPPYSIEAIVWGGSNQNILEAIQMYRPAGVMTWGTHIGTIEDNYGQVSTYRFSRAEEVDIYLDIDIVTSSNFPARGAELIKDICAEVIGGEDTSGAYQAGSVGVGEVLYQSELESELHNNIQGLQSVATELGKKANNKIDGNLELGDRETAVIQPDNIFITKS